MKMEKPEPATLIPRGAGGSRPLCGDKAPYPSGNLSAVIEAGTSIAMTSPSQFRPKLPIALDSEQWARDYNEIKELRGLLQSRQPFW